MKFKKIAVALCAAALSLTVMSVTAFAADAGVKIDAAHFPDANFREYVKEFDTDKNGSFSAEEIAAVTEIDCSGLEIGSLKGIENFTALTYLDCANNRLTSLDVSGCTALETLVCNGNYDLAELNVSKNTALIDLNCSYCSLTVLNVSANKKLTSLECRDNKLTELDVSKNTALENLQCQINKLSTGLKLDNNKELNYLDCFGCELTKLDISNNTKLEYLGCNGNYLEEIDTSKNPELIYLYCINNKLKELNISGSTKLTYLACSNNDELTKLDVSKNTALKRLECSYNSLTELDLSNNPELVYLDCEVCKLKKLNVRKNTKLEALYCDVNQLTELDVSGCAKLYNLDCGGNKLTKLDVSKNTALAYLYCNSNQLTSLDMSGCKELGYIYCHNNKLAELNISGNPNLIFVYTKGEDDDYRPLDAIEGILAKSYYDNSDVENTKNYWIIWDKATKIYTKSTSHTPHTWDSGKVTKAATYSATGVKTYTCTVCGAKKTSSIAKKTVKKLTAKTTYTCTTNAVRINWNKLSGVTGYKIFRYDDANKKWVAVTAVYDPNATNYKISGLKSGKVYKFRVKAFVKENNKFYFGESCSTISTATRPNTTTVTKANKTSTAVRLFWKKTTCTGYRILRYDSAKKKWVRVTAVGSSATTQYKISGLKKNTTYKFKVQPYVKVGSKVIDGAASAVFTVKTSK